MINKGASHELAPFVFMKLFYIFIVLMLPQVLNASEISGSISTLYVHSDRVKISYESEEDIEVLGVDFYSDGTLLRSGEKIFVIENQMKRYIRSLKDLEEYRAQEILNVNSETIDRYELKVFKNSDLIRGSDMRIYVVEGSTRKHVVSIEELREFYFGLEIYNVSDSIIERHVRRR